MELIDAVARTLFSFICHQDTSVLVSIDGRQVPLCPRCTGLHLGFLTAVMVLTGRNPSLRIRPNRAILLAALTTVPGIHWLLGYLDILRPDSLTRFGTGIVGGLAFASCVVIWRQTYPSHLGNSHQVSGSAVLAVALVLLWVMPVGIWATISMTLLMAVTVNLLFLANSVVHLAGIRSALSQGERT
jgi:uncharacterized membrane protein